MNKLSLAFSPALTIPLFSTPCCISSSTRGLLFFRNIDDVEALNTAAFRGALPGDETFVGAYLRLRNMSC